jgi:hypothetical protein
MYEVDRPRPILASVICFYEAVIVFFALLGFAFIHALRIVNPARTDIPTPPLMLLLNWLGYACAVAIVITLWQMRREAYYLAAIRFCLSLAGIVYSFTHPRNMIRVGYVGRPTPNLHAFGALGIMIIVISLSINAAIAFYVGDVTRPIYGSER